MIDIDPGEGAVSTVGFHECAQAVNVPADRSRSNLLTTSNSHSVQ